MHACMSEKWQAGITSVMFKDNSGTLSWSNHCIYNVEYILVEPLHVYSVTGNIRATEGVIAKHGRGKSHRLLMASTLVHILHVFVHDRRMDRQTENYHLLIRAAQPCFAVGQHGRSSTRIR